jgi:hypothetical protein
MSTCAALAIKYAAETHQPIPAVTDSADAKDNWLLTQTWGCLDKQGTFHDAEWCKVNNNIPPPARPNSTLGSRPAMINYLSEDGFILRARPRDRACQSSRT